MLEIENVIEVFRDLCCEDSRGIESFITPKTDSIILDRLKAIEEVPLTYVQLNQLLSFANISSISDGFYKYYWMKDSVKHPYQITKLSDYHKINFVGNNISSLSQLHWGFERMVVDSLLYFGNINAGFSYLHNKDYAPLSIFFQSKVYDTDLIANRGIPLDFVNINKEDRYLISEMACKTFESYGLEELIKFLCASFKEARRRGIKSPKISNLLEGKYVSPTINQAQLELSLTDIFEETVNDEKEIHEKCTKIANKFDCARKSAIKNTRFFLSLVHDLDVYVATSMRRKEDFIKIADTCETIFSDSEVNPLKLRYFDPTISAAERHEDKGLIECLMVKCCKTLIYSAGERESYGKDAEAAMALSLGKPVIFLCENTERYDFYKNVHPLTRLIDFSTGVANGAIVARNAAQVSELLRRIFSNDMQYMVQQKHKGYYTLVEKLTDSSIRIQTNDKFLSNTFWNYYRK